VKLCLLICIGLAFALVQYITLGMYLLDSMELLGSDFIRISILSGTGTDFSAISKSVPGEITLEWIRPLKLLLG